MPDLPLPRRPSLAVSTTVILLLGALWGYVRLFLFQDSILPITFVLPLLVCVWTGRRWQLWTLAGVFAVFAACKMWWVLPADQIGQRDLAIWFAVTLFNIVAGAVVVLLIIALREGLERRNATIAAQNAELEAQAEELSQQNDEIKAQAEELAEQNEEIESQAEEVMRQNEELIDLSARIGTREEILQGLLRSAGEKGGLDAALIELSNRMLDVVGPPAVVVGILERVEDSLHLVAQRYSDEAAALPEEWPLKDSIADIVLRQGRTAYVSDLERRPDLAAHFGAAAPQSILATPISGSEGQIGLLVACSRDATHWTEEQFQVMEWIAGQCGLVMENLRHRRELAERAAALESANQAKDRFLAMLSHELRTPLTPILAAAGVLQNDNRLPAEVREDLRMIRRNAAIQSRLIDDLLDLTRIGRGKLELDRQLVEAAPLLRDAAKIISAELDAKSQTLNLDLHGLDGQMFVGDGARLQQVFWNLLKNAVKFSPAGSAIELRARSLGDRIAVDVRDSGVGIDRSDMERIFLPFEQALCTKRRTNESGLGLGLAIAKAVVELHEGTLTVDSDGPGHGAIFTVSLPCVAQPNAPKPLVVEGASDGPGSIRILLVEDHEDTRELLVRLLQSSGFVVEQAGTATEALELFTQGDFQLVISDLGLPDLSGVELMQRLQEIRPGLPGICLTGHGMEQDVDLCRKAGFTEHLTKPVEFSRLQAAISRLDLRVAAD